MVHCTGRCKEPQFTARRGLTLTAALCQVNQQYAKQSGYIGNLPTAAVMCISPESLQTTAAQAASRSMASVSEVSPVSNWHCPCAVGES